VLDLVSCLRGNAPPDPVPVRTITQSEYRQELEQEAASEVVWSMDTVYAQPMSWLNLVPPGGITEQSFIEEQVQSYAAYYSHAESDITIITPDDPSTPLDPEVATTTLAHEMVHALQDRDVDLSARFEAIDYYDESLALWAMTEGEAMLFGTLVNAAFWGLDLASVHLERRFAALVQWTDQDVIADSAPWLSTFSTFPYSYGGRYAATVYAQGGAAAVRALPGSPPLGTLPVVLDSEITVDATPWAEIPPGPTGYELYSEDSLGSWILQVVLERSGSTAARELAAAWRADRLWIHTGNYSTAALWQIRFADGADLARAEAALRDSAALAPVSAVRSRTSEVLLFMGTAAVGVDTWADVVAPP
jgi:hypothetical protein